MKKIGIFYALLFSGLSLFANPGDTTYVTFHTLDSLSYYGSYIRTATMPTAAVTYRKIYFIYTIGKYDCPASATYCAQWDYSLLFELKPLNPAISTDSFEIARGITPYAKNSTFFPSTWTHQYVIDVTDYAPILKDMAELRAHYQGYSGGFTINTKLMYIEGTPEREPVQVQNMYKMQGHSYGDASNSIENAMIPVTMQFDPPAVSAALNVRMTGHGSNSADGCSEFCKKYYDVLLNTTPIAHTDLWKKCTFGDIPAQTGTWIFDRANWCPGEKEYRNTYQLSGLVATTPFILDIDMEPYTYASTSASLGFSSQLISYKAPTYTTDVSMEDIISPSTKDDYQKYNPTCGSPEIKIRNSGTGVVNTVIIKYGVAASPDLFYTWNGTLNFMDETTIKLPAFANAPGYVDGNLFTAEIVDVNGSPDQYSLNNKMTTIYKTPPTLPEKFIIRMLTNNTALTGSGSVNETSWKVMDKDGNMLFSRSNCSNSMAYYDTISLQAGCYTLAVKDSNNEDGVSWWFYPYYAQSPGNGSIQLQNISGGAISLVTSKFNSKYFAGDFGAGFLYNFKVDFPTGIKHIEKSEFNLDVFPNPAYNELHVDITLPAQRDVKVELIDVNGKQLYEGKYSSSQNIIIPTNNYATGVYMLKVTDKNNVQVRKIIIQK